MSKIEKCKRCDKGVLIIHKNSMTDHIIYEHMKNEDTESEDEEVKIVIKKKKLIIKHRLF